MAMFNSYVKLPEGKPKKIRFLKHGSCRMWLTTAHWHFENIENSALVA